MYVSKCSSHLYTHTHIHIYFLVISNVQSEQHNTIHVMPCKCYVMSCKCYVMLCRCISPSYTHIYTHI